ncbi:creatinine amidohydrolase [Bradyrhizobium sp. I1.8.5]|uniref:creatininase family protein n=1 Tax=Bradyrhizobium sp. I1.8.5 TaxID=3156365 RepID=UPI003395D8E5
MTRENLFSSTMAEMTANAVAEAASRKAAVLLPAGVMEAHGPHLPIGTDAFIALQLCRATQKYAAARGKETVIAPPYYWGINGVLGEFVGSFRIRTETAAALLTDVIDSLVANGFPDVFVVSHHGDRAHNDMILDVLQKAHLRGQAGARWLYAPTRWNMIKRLGQTGEEPIWVRWDHDPALDDFKVTGVFGVHADEYETAAIVRHYPETVDFEALRGLEPTKLTVDDLAVWRQGGEAARRLTPNGYFGAPNPVDPDLWRFYDETAKIMAEAIAR